MWGDFSTIWIFQLFEKYIWFSSAFTWGFPGGASANAGDIRDAGLIPGLRRSPAGGYGHAL